MKFSNISLSFMSSFSVDDLLKKNKIESGNPFIIISPHAGYVYSGNIAAISYNYINQNKKYDNVFILSTSHTTSYKGGSILLDEIYETPHGNLIINTEIGKNLIKDELFVDVKNYFKNDHTIEVQLPFILKRINHEKIVPIMIGDYDINNIKDMSSILSKYLIDDNLFIISSDFSHYPSYEDANVTDEETKDFIMRNNSKYFLDNISKINKRNLSTRMCGWTAYLTMLNMIEDKNISIKHLKYMNSGEIIGNRNNVVGYHSIVFEKNED